MKKIIAIIDIGSNSIRLSLYEKWTRLPYLIFADKVFAGLAENLSENHQYIHQKNYEKALHTAKRFKMLMEKNTIDRSFIFATSAVRDAINGQNLKNDIEHILQEPVKILSGEEEARYAALSIMSFFENPQGIIMDLGGGSLEIAQFKKNSVDKVFSFPYGVLRFNDYPVKKIVNDMQNSLHMQGNNTAYLIGGAWRSLARIYFYYYEYPLHVLHHLTMSKDELLQFFEDCTRDIEDVCHQLQKAISKKRLQLLPQTLKICQMIIENAPIEKFIFSSSSIRDGILFDMLDDEEKNISPLLTGCKQLCQNRKHDHDQEIFYYIDYICNYYAKRHRIAPLKKNLLKSAIHLKDISLYDHPEYRAEESFQKILFSRIVGLNHKDKIILSYSVAHRYFKTQDSHEKLHNFDALISVEEEKIAHLIGTLLRFYHLITASQTNHNAQKLHFSIEQDILYVTLSKEMTLYLGPNERYYLDKITHLLGIPMTFL